MNTPTTILIQPSAATTALPESRTKQATPIAIDDQRPHDRDDELLDRRTTRAVDGGLAAEQVKSDGPDMQAETAGRHEVRQFVQEHRRIEANDEQRGALITGRGSPTVESRGEDQDQQYAHDQQ